MSSPRHTSLFPFPYAVQDLGLEDADRAAADASLFEDFVAIVRRLRRECPWDREQTHASTAHLTIEEAYEVADADRTPASRARSRPSSATSSCTSSSTPTSPRRTARSRSRT